MKNWNKSREHAKHRFNSWCLQSIASDRCTYLAIETVSFTFVSRVSRCLGMASILTVVPSSLKCPSWPLCPWPQVYTSPLLKWKSKLLCYGLNMYLVYYRHNLNARLAGNVSAKSEHVNTGNIILVVDCTHEASKWMKSPFCK